MSTLFELALVVASLVMISMGSSHELFYIPQAIAWVSVMVPLISLSFIWTVQGDEFIHNVVKEAAKLGSTPLLWPSLVDLVFYVGFALTVASVGSYVLATAMTCLGLLLVLCHYKSVKVYKELQGEK